MGQETVYDFVIVDNVSMAASFSSDPFSSRIYNKISLFIECSGTPVGALSIETSNNYNPNVPDARVDWTPMQFNPSIVALSGQADQEYYFDIYETANPYLRVTYTSTSGTGTMYAALGSKEI